MDGAAVGAYRCCDPADAAREELLLAALAAHDVAVSATELDAIALDFGAEAPPQRQAFYALVSADSAESIAT